MRLISAARSASLPQSTTSVPASARTIAKAVPHEPLPMTAALVIASSSFLAARCPPLAVQLVLHVRVARARPPAFARVDADRWCLLAADVLDERCDRGHDPFGGLVQRLRARGDARVRLEVGEVD